MFVPQHWLLDGWYSQGN